MTQVLGIDAGNFETKVIHSKGYDCFQSSIGEWRDRTVTDKHSLQDMEFKIVNQYDHYKGFAGPLANVESEYGGTVFGLSKNHRDAITRVLLAIWRNIEGNSVKIVVGQPYSSHTEDEKLDIISALKGKHTVTINDKTKEFIIEDVRVGIEGAMSFLVDPIGGAVNLIDVGSGTINCIHFLNKKIVDRKCNTLPFGSETSKDGVNFEGMANGIFRNMSSVWNKNDQTIVTGGSAKYIIEPLKKYYPTSKVIDSRANINGISVSLEPKYSNAIGMYYTGMKIFG